MDRKALQDVPNFVPALRYRAASLGLLGRLEEGRQVVPRTRANVPRSSAPTMAE